LLYSNRRHPKTIVLDPDDNHPRSNAPVSPTIQ
jgi:hypothetical protein